AKVKFFDLRAVPSGPATKKLPRDFNRLCKIAELCISSKRSIYCSAALSRQLRKLPVTDCLKLGQFRLRPSANGLSKCKVAYHMSKRVLIVDDDPIQRRLLEETIKRFGFETRNCGSGEQALQILEGQDRDLIALVLLDLVMPGVDGMAVLDRVGHIPGMPPIIV